MTKDKISVPDTRLNARTRRLFLNHLAETANVAASARAAGVASSGVYAERRRSAGFRDDWARALGEGYARLETDLLAEALLAANGKTAAAFGVAAQLSQTRLVGQWSIPKRVRHSVRCYSISD